MIGGQDVKAPSPDASLAASEVGNAVNGEVSSDMKLEDLLMVYDREKQKFLSSFVGQVQYLKRYLFQNASFFAGLNISPTQCRKSK